MKEPRRTEDPEILEALGEVGLDHAEPTVPRRRSSVPPYHRHEAEAGAVVGAIAGAAIGAVAGPPGIFAGTAIGAAIGVLAGAALDHNDAWRDREEHLLDEDIGVESGDLGVAPPNQPRARIGAYSAASLGTSALPPSSQRGSMSEGPIPPPED